MGIRECSLSWFLRIGAVLLFRDELLMLKVKIASASKQLSCSKEGIEYILGGLEIRLLFAPLRHHTECLLCISKPAFVRCSSAQKVTVKPASVSLRKCCTVCIGIFVQIKAISTIPQLHASKKTHINHFNHCFLHQHMCQRLGFRRLQSFPWLEWRCWERQFGSS